MKLEFKTGERTYQLDVTANGESYDVTLDGEVLGLEVLIAEPGELDLRVADQRVKAYVAALGDERFVFLNGRVFTFRLPTEDTLEEMADDSGPNIISQMPGTVVKILVEAGQQVTAGARLLILESMKMEAEVATPIAGSVTAVHVAPGQTVGRGDLLVDIEPATADKVESTE